MLLARSRQLAQRLGLTLTAYTFPATAPALLPTAAKRALLQRLADTVLVADWDDLREVDAETFLRRELAGRLDARAVVMGADHRFGKNRGGDAQLARRLAPELTLKVEVVPPLEVGGAPVSARRVRELLHAGRVADAATLLGRPPALWGTPVRGAGLGRDLGYPTLNLHIEEELLLPAHGVYAAWGHHAAGEGPGLFYLGDRPTFPGLSLSAELHLLEPPAATVERLVEVHLLAYLRGDERFADSETLKEQIRRDIGAARRVLARAPVPVPVLVTAAGSCARRPGSPPPLQ